MGAQVSCSQSTRKILLVEDDRFLRKAAEVVLKRSGYTVVTAPDGETALDVAKAESPDLILLDLIMPRMQGFEVLQRLKDDAATKHIPVIVLTNLSQDADRQRTIDAGAADYLVKANMSLEELSAAIGRKLAVTA